MKTAFILSLVIVFIIGSCAKQENKFPQGAWQLVSSTHFTGNIIAWQFPGDYSGSDIVIFSEGHLLSVGLFKRDTIVINNYVGASYTLDGNHYEETLLYFPNPESVGQIIKQILELRNDTLIKSYPCDDNWELNKSEYTVEKFVRIK